MPRLSIAILAAALCGLAANDMPAAAAPASLDGFLPFEDDCRVSRGFGEWAESLSEGVERLTLEPHPKTPEAFADVFGPARLHPPPSAESLGIVEVPVAGATYRGLPVAAIRIVEPNGVPRSDYAVRFAGDPDAVRTALAPLLAAQAALPEAIGVLTLGAGPDGPTLRCVVDF